MPLASPAVLSQPARAHIDQWLKKYPKEQAQSAVIAALTYVQEENGGWLSRPLMDAVAAYLGMPKIAVYEVATFYTMFVLKPVGKHKIYVCTNISCMLGGSKQITDHLQKKLGIQMGETTKDGRFTLLKAECLAACGGAPMMQIGPQYYENLTTQAVDDILANLE